VSRSCHAIGYKRISAITVVRIVPIPVVSVAVVVIGIAIVVVAIVAVGIVAWISEAGVVRIAVTEAPIP
jgi:hypothetical protein